MAKKEENAVAVEAAAEPVTEEATTSTPEAPTSSSESPERAKTPNNSAKALNSLVTNVKRKSNIIGVDGSRTLHTATERDRDDEFGAILNTSYKAHTPVSIKLVKYTYIKGNLIAQGYIKGYSSYKISVPFEQLIDEEGLKIREELSKTAPPKTPREWKEYQVDRMLGSEIDVQITYFRKSDRTGWFNAPIFASRIQAQKRKAAYNFWVKSKKTGNLHVKEGDIVEARVVVVNRANVIAEVLGVETVIRNRELSWKPIQDAQLVCSLDKYLLVKVKKIEKSFVPKETGEKDENGTPKIKNVSVTKLDVSAKETTVNPMVYAVNEFEVKQKCSGIISYIHSNNSIIVEIGDAVIYCPPPTKGRVPQIGSRVSLRITGVFKDQLRICGLATWVY